MKMKSTIVLASILLLGQLTAPISAFAEAMGTTDSYAETASQQMITGQDYTMYIGDTNPTVSDFRASATDKDGMKIPVTANLLTEDTAHPGQYLSEELATADLSKTGDYIIELSSPDGQSKNVKLTVLENKQTIHGTDYTMSIGGVTPTIENFQATATDKTGASLAVTADLSSVDLNTAGEYPVVLTSEDGQTKEVTLSIVNSQMINGTDYTMNRGDPKPTVENFQASATDKDGNISPVNVNFDAVDFDTVGEYPVVLTSEDGQTKEVTLTITDIVAPSTFADTSGITTSMQSIDGSTQYPDGNTFSGGSVFTLKINMNNAVTSIGDKLTVSISDISVISTISNNGGEAYGTWNINVSAGIATYTIKKSLPSDLVMFLNITTKNLNSTNPVEINTALNSNSIAVNSFNVKYSSGATGGGDYNGQMVFLGNGKPNMSIPITSRHN